MVVEIKLSSGSTKELEPPTEDLEIKEEVPDPPIANVTIHNVESMTSVHEELDIKEDIKEEENDPSEMSCSLVHCPIMEGSLVQNMDLPIIAESPLHIPKTKPKRTLISTSKMKAYMAMKNDVKVKKKSLNKSKKKVIVPSLIKKTPQYTNVTPYGVAVKPCSVPLVPCDIHDNVQYKSKKSFSHKNCEEEDPLLISVRLKSGEILKTSSEILEKLCHEIKSPDTKSPVIVWTGR